MKKLKKLKKQILNNHVVSTKTIYTSLFLFLILIIGFISKDIYFLKTQEYKNKIYKKVDQDILEKFDVMLNEKLNTSLLVSSSLSKNVMIKKSLKQNNPDLLDMDKLLEEMRTKKEYVDIQAEVIDANGKSFKRSWTNLKGDDLVKDDPQMEHLIKYPRVYTTIQTSKYGVTFTNKIPIFDENNIFLGYFGVNVHFDALADIFSQRGYKIVILLNKRDSHIIQQELSYSKNFINDCYVVNSNADDYLLRVIKQNDANEFCDDDNNNYIVHEKSDHLISKYNIKNLDNSIIAKAIIFRTLDEIDYQDLNFMQKAHIIVTIISIFLIFFFIKYLYMANVFKDLKLENEELVIINEDLKEKTDQLDFNDKKLDNLFNMQPNLMFMHNGKEITKANNRFMGFFNRFGTFDGFKKKHKCVCELFEKYEAPNYIWDQYIDGEFWIDYLLQNPRKLYKVVMSINGDPHHFIVKFNEMDYSKHVTERIIIVALVDMTQDLVNYKSSKETAELLKDIRINEKLELEEEKKNTDISYEIVEGIKHTIEELSSEKLVNINIEAIDSNSIPREKMVEVDGLLKFKDIESKWNFYISCISSYKILNLISDNKFELVDEMNKDVVDTAKEFIYTLSINMCNIINQKKFHDLQNGKYTQSEIKEITKRDLSKLENVFKISIIFAQDIIEIYTRLDKDLIPFVNMIVENKEIVPYEYFGKTVDVEQLKDEEVVEDIKKTEIGEEKKELVQSEAKTINNVIATPIKIQKKVTSKAEKAKLDPYTLIQDSLLTTLNNILETTLEKIQIEQIYHQNIKNMNGVLFTNSLVANGSKNVDWKFFIPAKTLSKIFNIMIDDTDGDIVETIDNGLHDISKQILLSLGDIVSKNTNKKITLQVNKDEIVETLAKTESYKVFDLGISLDNNKLNMYLLIKGM